MRVENALFNGYEPYGDNSIREQKEKKVLEISEHLLYTWCRRGGRGI